MKYNQNSLIIFNVKLHKLMGLLAGKPTAHSD